MKRYIIAGLLGVSVLSSCVKNPNLTEEAYLSKPDAAKSWAQGLRRQLALTMNGIVVNVEIASDNYFNNYTQYSKVFDVPQMDYTDVDVNNIQLLVQRLRAAAEYGMNTILPGDASATATDRALIIFSRAYAHILSGELFVALPASTNGVALTPQEHYAKALEFLDEALAVETDAVKKTAYTVLKARVYYNLGDAANAEKFALEAAASKDMLFNVAFDGQNAVSNEMQTAVFTSLPNRLAPLPRLDFLDPKYSDNGVPATEQRPVAIVKAEEARLILAEVQVSASRLAEARTTLKNLLSEVVNARPYTLLDDSRETRNGGNRNDYPLVAVQVKFDAADSLRSNYVINRKGGTMRSYTVSATRVTAAEIDAAATQDALLYLVYRLRQEIFFAEGRRMTDLGIKMPVSQTEQLNNRNITDAHIKPQIPAFIPVNRGMDDFTYDKTAGVVTITYDMNKVMVQNKSAKEIFPFIN
ncbi:tetratricopeptide (TPR) repeat protein [Filimonas zeae]|uniref:Tetratricopeptide repeat protein n=1 Tax=Filimonas zeae TaxID=1737353 RepID=A0A917J073_9BACT|nr:tetratricopeptide repeat protein [Filimonas zeae]MDR6339820.1 tetratricopeptide (TPR) repeat protein [Filimonas zeae]GGH69809.1 hypothetical protein GCM10011379_27480 [Filimonas zeae]